jgi:predicted PurR-regulated permease PerM
MVTVLRRMGIALGSLVAGMLCVGFVGGIGMVLLGIPASPASSVLATLASLVLGWLIYRDIMRRERPPA